MLKWFNRGTPAAEPASPGAAAEERPPAANPDELMRKAFPLHQAGDLAAAADLYRQILAIAPNYADAHYLLGQIARHQGSADRAIRHIRDALRSNDREPAFHRTLGEIHYALGHWQEAITYLGNTVTLDPSDFETWNNLGCACNKVGLLGAATGHFQKALAIAQDSPMVLNNVAMALKDRGRADESIEALGRAHRLNPGDPDFLSNYLYALNFSTRVTGERRFHEHLEFDRLWGTGRHGALPRRAADPDPGRRLRLGYFSPDLRAHPVSCFLEAPLTLRDRQAFEVWCYYLHPWADAVTARFKALSDHWVDCNGLTDEQVAARITQDKIDILVDLAGHTGGSRPAILGRRPAPVSVTWLGYPNTTGLRSVDYKITDAWCDPPGLTERYHTETLLRLPQQWCYTKPGFPAEVTALPATRNGHVRFASFNNASKINEDMLRIWGRILQRVPTARLLIWGVGAEQAAEIREVFQACGADAGRLDFSDRTPFPKQVAMYQTVDIALDTFPYSGVTTTFNSLWMGVPVITLAGDCSAARSTHAILNTIGLPEWSARSADDYVDIAACKAQDLEALGQLRGRLRDMLEGSAFMDGRLFSRQLEALYREAWATHCRAIAANGHPSTCNDPS